MIIDSHNHFWKYDPLTHDWIDESMGVIRRDFLPAGFEPVLVQNGIDGTIAVQADQSEQETFFLLELGEKDSRIKGVVGWVDLRSDHIFERLKYFSQFEKLKGFRHIIQSEPDPNFMLDVKFRNGISLLSEFGYTYDLLIYPQQMGAALKLIELNPQQSFVIDHLAKPNIKAGKIDLWRDLIIQIGRHKNVMCKLSGMVTEADWQAWGETDFEQYIDVVVKAFGIDRVMFGSDWPVCLLAASYGQVKNILANYFSSFPLADRQRVFAQNAIDFYQLN